jgi:hypothetical protein
MYERYFGRSVGGLSRHLEAEVEGRWIDALVEGSPSDWRAVRAARQAIVSS